MARPSAVDQDVSGVDGSCEARHAGDTIAPETTADVAGIAEDPTPEMKESSLPEAQSPRTSDDIETIPHTSAVTCVTDEEVSDADSWSVSPPKSGTGRSESIEEPFTKENEREAAQQARSSSQRHSERTEALIQAAARAVVQTIEQRNAAEEEGTESEYAADTSLLSTSTREEADDDHEDLDPAPHHTDGEVAEQASEDDVFSYGSHRVSTGSSHHDNLSDFEASTKRVSDGYDGKSPRISHISNLSRYEQEAFVPTPRESPRPTHRIGSTFRSMPTTSPTPSIYSGSPRSARRRHGQSNVSHLSSPQSAKQYSSKRQSTPTRFKSPQEEPLVLLHVSLLPLRWAWGDVLQHEECNVLKVNEPAPESAAGMEQLKSAWRLLQDRMGDTVLQRGILLPHPQNDFEVLEERLLEALELPLRRRARILECGHYLGPSNEAMVEASETEPDSDADGRRASHLGGQAQKHWCKTCRNDIKYESLGKDAIFRTKVYASNGLMKAGAWEACWKEMERVDIEVEPIVSDDMLRQLQALAMSQNEATQRHHADEDDLLLKAEIEAAELEVAAASGHLDDTPQIEVSSPADASPTPAEPMSYKSPRRQHRSSARRQREEERLREIYGDTRDQSTIDEVGYAEDSLLHPESAKSRRSHQYREIDDSSHDTTFHTPHISPDGSHSEDPRNFIPPQTSPSPSAEAHARRESRRRSLHSATLTDLLVETGKALLRDPKSIAIIVLSVLIMLLAFRSPSIQMQAAPPAQMKVGDTGMVREEASITETPAVVVQTETQTQTVYLERPRESAVVVGIPAVHVLGQEPAGILPPASDDDEARLLSRRDHLVDVGETHLVNSEFNKAQDSGKAPVLTPLVIKAPADTVAKGSIFVDEPPMTQMAAMETRDEQKEL